MSKVDFKRELRELFTAPAGEFIRVTVPRLSYLAVEGVGDPNTSSDYARAVEALYAVSYALKFASKRVLNRDYVVPPLEGLWWSEDYSVFQTGDRDGWQWTMMIMTPDWITRDLIDESIVETGRKKVLPALSDLAPLFLEEGPSLQTLHIGPYAAEGPTLERLHTEVLPGLGLEPDGHHHEIYLSDPRKVEPEKLRTILRQPVREGSAQKE